MEEIEEKRGERDRFRARRKLWPPLPKPNPYFSAGVAAALAVVMVNGWDDWARALYLGVVFPGCFRLADELFRWLKWKKVKTGTGDPTPFVREYAKEDKRRIIAVMAAKSIEELEADPDVRWTVYRERWGA